MSWLKRLWGLGGTGEPDRPIFLLLAFGVLAIAWSHIFYKLDVPSLWIDEAVSWRSASGSWAQLYQYAKFGQDCGGIVFSAVLKVWVGVFGASEWSLRMPSAIAGIGFVALMMRVGLVLWGRRAALYVGLIACLNAGTLTYARESRAYALLLALAALGFLGLATFWKRSPRRGIWLLWLSCPLVAMTHVFGVFIVAGFAGAQALLWWRAKNATRRTEELVGAAVPIVFALVLAVAWSLVMRSRIEMIMTNFWTTEAAIGSLLSSYHVVVDEWIWIAVGLVFLIVRAEEPSRRLEAMAIAMVALSVTAGPGIASLLNQGSHHFVFSRYLLPVVPCAALLGGYALNRLGWVPGVALIVLVFWMPLVSPFPRLHAPNAHYGQNVRGATHLLSSKMKNGDEVAILPAWNDLTFEYYGFAIPEKQKGESIPFKKWVAGEMENRLWIADLDRTLARSAHAGRLASCDTQRLHGIDFYLCEPRTVY